MNSPPIVEDLKEADEESRCAKNYYIPIRRALVDFSLLCFIICGLIITRITVNALEEMRLFRTELMLQVAQTRMSLQMQEKDVAANLNKLTVNSSVLIDRFDSQFTKARGQIRDAAKTAQQSDVADRKEIRAVIKQNLDTQADIQQREEGQDAQQKNVVPVVVTPITMPPAPPASPSAQKANSAPASNADDVEAPRPKRKSIWKRWLTKLHLMG